MSTENDEEYEGEPGDDETIDLGELGNDTQDTVADDETVEPDPKIELAKAQARADALADENARLLKAREEAPPPERRLEAAPGPTRKSLADAVDGTFMQEFADNPETAMKKLLSKVDEEVERRTANVGAPAAVNQGMLVVDSFKARMRESDAEEYAVAIKHFNARIEQMKRDNPSAFAQLAAMNPTNVDTVLGIEWDAAVGKGERESRQARKAAADVRRPAPAPNLGGGRASGGGSVTTRGSDRGKLSPFEEDMVKRAKAAGLSDADCRDLVREDRAERRQRGA